MKLGGRGKCKKCGTYQNNVSYHEAHQCVKNKPSRVNPDFLTPEKLKEAAQKRKMEYVSPLTTVG